MVMAFDVEEHNKRALAIMLMDKASTVPWKRGLPRARWYDGMTDDYEVYFSPGGQKWHRRRTPEDAAECARLTAEIHAIANPTVSPDP